MSSANGHGLTLYGAPVTVTDALEPDEVLIVGAVNTDPALCPMRECDELAGCGDRCSCPPCICPDCLKRTARARARRDDDDPTTLF